MLNAHGRQGHDDCPVADGVEQEAGPFTRFARLPNDIPASDGPINRAPLNMVEFRAIALPKSARSSTMSITNAWRVGMSKAFTIPNASGQRHNVPNLDKAHNYQQGQHQGLDHCQSLGDQQRAMTVPAIGEHARQRSHDQRGDLAGKPNQPQQKGRVAQAKDQPVMATCCIQVPIRETPWPKKKSR